MFPTVYLSSQLPNSASPHGIPFVNLGRKVEFRGGLVSSCLSETPVVDPRFGFDWSPILTAVVRSFCPCGTAVSCPLSDLFAPVARLFRVPCRIFLETQSRLEFNYPPSDNRSFTPVVGSESRITVRCCSRNFT